MVLDVRTPTELTAGHVEGARNVDIEGSSFPDNLSRLDHDASYVVYCQSGNRSPAAFEVKREQGFVDVAARALSRP